MELAGWGGTLARLVDDHYGLDRLGLWSSSPILVLPGASDAKVRYFHYWGGSRGYLGSWLVTQCDSIVDSLVGGPGVCTCDDGPGVRA